VHWRAHQEVFRHENALERFEGGEEIIGDEDALQVGQRLQRPYLLSLVQGLGFSLGFRAAGWAAPPATVPAQPLKLRVEG